jgi:hypothetical protein
VRDWLIRNGFEVNPAVSPEGYLNLWAVFQVQMICRVSVSVKKFSKKIPRI